MKKRTVALLLAVVLVLGAAIGGTLAWLTAKTDPVVNTFTSGDVAITLTETWNTDTDNDEENDAWTAQLIPGKEYAKNPVVTVTRPDTNVDCYLFVKFEEIGSPATYLTYDSTLDDTNSGWTKLTGVTGVNDVWYRIVEADDTDISWNLLAGDKVTVKSTVTKSDMQTLKAANATLPSLKYTAYAAQKDNLTVEQAWAAVSK